ncbi:YrhK family protein [Salinifilum ghardaiensis]
MSEHSDSSSTPLAIRLGREELLIRKRYETLSIVNDVLIALWFLIGSVLFFWDSTNTAGTWLFVLGSAELGIRPLIRLRRHVHLKRIHETPHPAAESDQDF